MHDLNEPVTEVDPDLAQAIEHLLPVAAEIRRLTKRLAGLKEGTRDRGAVEQSIRNQMEFIIVRADRLQMSPDALLVRLTAELDTKARRGRPAPVRETSRSLRAAHEKALIELQSATAQVRLWNGKVGAATAAVAAAEEAMRSAGLMVEA